MLLLKRRADIHITMTDTAPSIGQFIEPPLSSRVEIHAATAAIEMVKQGRAFDTITIADVMHHVPFEMRQAFWSDLRRVCEDTGCRLIIVKDVKPGTIRGLLSVLSDRYVTGDRHVSLILPEAMMSDIRLAFCTQLIDIEQSEPDRANYCLVIRLSERGIREN